ncbi:MAG: hypothetical protein A2Y00_04390 [Omnitrophica WOR_2 bacterium GWF2_43_52]|nr:MAG: hypothetical protein A2Y00_04390 [Omnitrophica WOR_2 bacterium GWF2_43_52]OGX55514.1 MAG: hypothetical protein A2460_04965 [Omnitrophica WOR_2 bacterium RIFOXYC2_FULL_43_9]
MYDKKDADVRPQPPVNTTVIGDYYLSAPDDKGTKDRRAEEFLSIIEGWAKPALDWIINHPDSLSKVNKDFLAMFIAFTYCRSPRSVQAIKEMDEAGLDYVLEQVKEVAKDSVESRKLYEKFSQKEDKDPRLTYDEFLQVISDPKKGVYVEVNEKHAIGESLLFAEVFHRKIVDLDWHVRIATKEHFFITSDAPVTIFTPLPNNQVIFGGGLGLPTVQLTFPLSPKVCLHLDRNPIGSVERAGASYINEINCRSVYMAERFVISPFCSNRIKKFVEKYSATYKAPKINAEEIINMFKKRGFDLRDKLREGFKESLERCEQDVHL